SSLAMLNTSAGPVRSSAVTVSKHMRPMRRGMEDLQGHIGDYQYMSAIAKSEMVGEKSRSPDIHPAVCPPLATKYAYATVLHPAEYQAPGDRGHTTGLGRCGRRGAARNTAHAAEERTGESSVCRLGWRNAHRHCGPDAGVRGNPRAGGSLPDVYRFTVARPDQGR